MSLAERIKYFDQIAARFENTRPHPLLIRHKVPKALLERVKVGAALCIARSLPDPTGANWANMTNYELLLKQLEEQFETAPNITPNGAIVPKRDLNLEYNLFARSFAAVIEGLNIEDMVACWSNPPLLRVKRGHFDKDLLKRKYSSENRHTEAWFPTHTSRAITLFLPLFGDIEHNSVEFFAPPEDFSEDWLVPKESYESARNISDRYQRIDVAYEPGYLYIADTATMHQSVRYGNTGPRVSVDTNVYPVLPEVDSLVERPRLNVLRTLGEQNFYVFFDAMNQISERPDGGKNKAIISLPSQRPE